MRPAIELKGRPKHLCQGGSEDQTGRIVPVCLKLLRPELLYLRPAQNFRQTTLPNLSNRFEEKAISEAVLKKLWRDREMSSSAMSEKRPKVHAPSPNPPPSFTKRLTGSHYEKFSSILMGQIGSTLWTAHSDEDQQTQIDACAEALAGIAAQDEVEGVLAAQMIACHSAAMECFRRAMLNEQSI